MWGGDWLVLGLPQQTCNDAFAPLGGSGGPMVEGMRWVGGGFEVGREWVAGVSGVCRDETLSHHITHTQHPKMNRKGWKIRSDLGRDQQLDGMTSSIVFRVEESRING